MNLENYFTGLLERDGILFSSIESKVSYPEEGNENSYQLEENSFWFKHRNDCIIEGVKKFSPGSIFFDVGGGNGYVAKGLENSGITTVLIEPGLHGCLNAKKRNLKNIVCATLENATLKKNSVSSIGLFDVVEHIEGDVDFLRSINNYLKENGLVYITVPAFNALWSNEDIEAGHFRRYTTKTLEEKLISSGFIIEYSTYIFSVLPLAVYLFRTLPSKLGFNKNSNDLAKNLKEHENKNNFTEQVLNRIWKFELNKVMRGEKIPVGGSCFVIARKKT